eukprot:165476_1
MMRNILNKLNVGDADTLNTVVYSVGLNHNGDLGFGDKEDRKELTKLKQANVETIISGSRYTIYANFNSQTFYAAGHNGNGECGVGKNTKYITKCMQVEYFKKNKIKIQKICTNCSGYSLFWVTDKNELYGNGMNDSCRNQLGFADNSNRNIPERIHGLNHIIDVQCNLDYTIALSSPKYSLFIISNWFRSVNTQTLNDTCSIYSIIPYDIINLIVMYHSKHKVYFAGKQNSFQRAKPVSYKFEVNKTLWFEIAGLSDKDITKIAIGAKHALFLDSDGVVYVSGDNHMGQQGNPDLYCEYVRTPKRLEYFVENNIKIKEIKCGMHHNLVLDKEGKLFAFGWNAHGQCGVSQDVKSYDSLSVTVPMRVPAFQDKTVKVIECGEKHSYAMTEDKKHYFWGGNRWSECIINSSTEIIKKPQCVDHVIDQITNDKKEIFSVSMGIQNTKLILIDK